MTKGERSEDALMEIIGSTIESNLQRNGIEREEAERVAVSACLAVQRDIGGSQVYITKASATAQVGRDREIVAAFHGDNYLELAKRFNLSVRRIRQILARDLAARRMANPIKPIRK